MKYIPVLNVIFVLSVIVSVSSAQPHENVLPLAETLQTGFYWNIDIEGDRLYAATVYGFDIVDITVPEDPELLARIPSEANAVRIAVRHDFVFLADDGRGLHVYDAIDPENVRLCWSYPDHGRPYYVSDIMVLEDRLYFSTFNEGLVIFDISNPAEPQFLTSLVGDFGVTTLETGASMSFIGDPNAPSIIPVNLQHMEDIRFYDPVEIADYPWAIATEDTMLYIAQSDSGIGIYSIADPERPYRLQNLAVGAGKATSVALHDAHLYIGKDSDGLVIVDVSDPADPEIVFQDDQDFFNCMDVHFAGNLLYLAQGWLSATVINPENPSQPELTAQEDLLPPVVNRMTVWGNTVYLSRYSQGVIAIDISTPAEPEILDFIDSVHAMDVQTHSAGWLYTTVRELDSDRKFLQTWSLDNPLDPQLQSSTELEALADIYVSDNRMCLNYRDEYSAEVWDLTDPGEPVYAAAIPDIQVVRTTIDNEYLYLTDLNNILYFIDVSDPENPEVIRQTDRIVNGYDVVKDGDRVYVADGRSIKVFDLSHPLVIREVNEIRMSGWTYDIQIADSILYASNGYHGIAVYSLHADQRYDQIGYLNTHGIASILEISDGIICVADYYDLTICQFDPETGFTDQNSVTADDFELYPAFPNPFNSVTNLQYNLPVESKITLQIYNLNGQLLNVLLDEVIPAGRHNVIWDAKNMAAGTYYLHLRDELSGVRSVQEIILVK